MSKCDSFVQISNTLKDRFLVVYGDTSESLGIRIKDEMEHRGFKGWFDLDDLKKIDQESINKGYNIVFKNLATSQ